MGSGAYGDYAIGPKGAPWTYTGTSGVAGNGSAVTSGNPNAPQGTQVSFTYGSTISQAVNFTAGSYTISLDAAQRGNTPGNIGSLTVNVDGKSVGTFTPSGSTYTAFTTNSFTVGAGNHTIALVGGGVNTVLIDQVAIQSTSTSPPPAPPPAPPPSPPPSTVTQPSDPGFETPSVGSGAVWRLRHRPQRRAVDVHRHVRRGRQRHAVTSGNPNAPQGTQVSFTYGSTISQAVNFTAGNYTISLDAAQRGNTPGNIGSLTVKIDGQSVGTFTPSGSAYTAFTTSSFMVGAGNHTIALVGGGANTVLIDQVSIQSA